MDSLFLAMTANNTLSVADGCVVTKAGPPGSSDHGISQARLLQ